MQRDDFRGFGFDWRGAGRAVVGQVRGEAERAMQDGLAEIAAYAYAQEALAEIEPLAEAERAKLEPLEAKLAELQGQREIAAQEEQRIRAEWAKLRPTERVKRDRLELELIDLGRQRKALTERIVPLAEQCDAIRQPLLGMQQAIVQLRAVRKPGPYALPGLREWLGMSG